MKKSKESITKDGNEAFSDQLQVVGTSSQFQTNESTDQDLRKSLEEWEKAFNVIPDLVAIIDTDFRIVKANAALAHALGCAAKDTTGRYCFELIHGLSSVPEYCPHARTMASRQEENEEIHEVRLGGTFDVTSTPLFDKEGMLTGSVYIARDITNREKKEKLLAEYLALGEYALSHSMKEILTMVTDKAELLTASKVGFLHFLDKDEKEITHQAWSTNTLKTFCTSSGNELHYPIEKAGVWTDCFHERRPVVHNDYNSLPHRRGFPEGHTIITRELVIPVMNNGKVVAILGVGNKADDYNEHDIELLIQLTNLAYEYVVRKRFEEALHQSEHYARVLLNAIPDLIFRMNRDGVYLDYKASVDDLHYQSSPIIGKNNRDMTPPGFANLIEEKILSTLEHQRMERFEYQLHVPGKGMRTFEARMVPSGNDEVTAITRDISDRIKTEEALKKKIDELEWFNRLMIDREIKMIELKKEINILANRLGEGERYVIHGKYEKQ